MWKEQEGRFCSDISQQSEKKNQLVMTAIIKSKFVCKTKKMLDPHLDYQEDSKTFMIKQLFFLKVLQSLLCPKI